VPIEHGHRQIVGSGLGLAIAKRAVERAGGSISLESERFVGAKVTIALPRRTS
jgi:signal transduction histidine kinase